MTNANNPRDSGDQRTPTEHPDGGWPARDSAPAC